MKWGSGTVIASDSRWFCGPDFLRQPEECWPGNEMTTHTTEEELVSCNIHCLTPASLVDVTRFSRWERLLRTIAYVLRFLDNCRCLQRSRTTHHVILHQWELERAETLLWKQAQEEYFGSEVAILEASEGGPENRHKLLQKSSVLYKLWPFMDEWGVVRKRNRLENAEFIQHGTKYPVILPRQHRITFLIVDSYHRRFRHGNRETIVNEIRQVYEIPKLRSLVAKVAKGCTWCKVFYASPCTPPMAPLPKVRVTPYVRPFT